MLFIYKYQNSNGFLFFIKYIKTVQLQLRNEDSQIKRTTKKPLTGARCPKYHPRVEC